MKTYSLFFLITVIFSVPGLSQPDDSFDSPFPKNVIYGTVGWGVLYGTLNINYERNLFKADRKAVRLINLKLSYGRYSSWGIAGPSHSIALSTLSGKKNNHLEANLGFAVLFDRLSYDIGVSNANYPYPGYEAEPKMSEYLTPLPVVSVGYRFQKPNGKFVFRTGIGIPDAVYFSFGLAF